MMAAFAPWRLLVAVAIVFAHFNCVLAETPTGHSARAPRDIVLVLDNSGSMRKNDRNFAMKHAAGEFIKTAPPNSHIGVIIFDSNVKYAFHLAPAAGPTQEAMLGSLQQLDYRGRWTNIPAAVEQAVTELKSNGREGTSKAVVLLTDGVVETGDMARDKVASDRLRQEVVADAEAHQIRMFSVALGPRSDTDLLQTMANRTNGEYFWAATGDDLPQLFGQISSHVAKLGAVAETVTEKSPETTAPDTAASTDDEHKTATSGAGEESAQSSPTQQVESKIPTKPVAGDSAGESKAVEPAVVATTTPARRTSESNQLRSADTDQLPSSANTSSDQYDESPAPVRQRSNVGARSRSSGTDWWLDGLGGLLLLTLILLGLMIWRSRNNTLRGPDRLGPSARSSANLDGGQTPQAYLHDLSGVTGRQRHEIGNAITLIGRVAPNPEDRLGSIVIDRPTIGRRHAVIERKHYGFWLIDQHSKNGTYVNDYRVTDEVCLTHGDRVRFHEYDFEFVLAGLGLADETISVGELILLNNKTADARSSTVRQPHSVDITSPDDPNASGHVKSGSNKGG